ncbi:MAG: acyl-CoA reductase [Bacteroidetes bacterium]|nr:acyl-CoA reductase [Bacteroidota bacterium]
MRQRIGSIDQWSSAVKNVMEQNTATPAQKKLLSLAENYHQINGWFTKENILHRLNCIATCLKKETIEKWLKNYSGNENIPSKNIVVILAGNIPFAGFDDLLCVLLSGNIFTGKLSSNDKILLPALVELLAEIDPSLAAKISFTEKKISSADAVIATGSNNSSRYFEHYFSEYPHIIRRNRNGIAVLNGNETETELQLLGEDVFRYFGLGCRSVSKIFVPEEYDFSLFFESIVDRGEAMMACSKYMNNYDYHKTIYLLNNEKLLDNNFLVLKNDIGISSPAGVLFYENYSSFPELEKKLGAGRELIQCIVSGSLTGLATIPFGTAQQTLPWNYADDVDVMDFLLKLH